MFPVADTKGKAAPERRIGVPVMRYLLDLWDLHEIARLRSPCASPPVGAGFLAGCEEVSLRARLRELPGPGRRGPRPRSLRTQLRAAGGAQEEIRSDEFLPVEPEHSACELMPGGVSRREHEVKSRTGIRRSRDSSADGLTDTCALTARYMLSTRGRRSGGGGGPAPICSLNSSFVGGFGVYRAANDVDHLAHSPVRKRAGLPRDKVNLGNS